MEEKGGGDILICSIYSFLFVCLTAGGSFLFMHMHNEHPQEWHVVAGMTLVGLPWCFWISTCAYTCVKHSFFIHPNPTYMLDPPPSTTTTSFKATTPKPEAITDYDRVSLDSPRVGNRSSTDSNSPMDISASDGDGCVKFSGVIVAGDEESHGHAHHQHHQQQHNLQDEHNKESEFPTVSSV